MNKPSPAEVIGTTITVLVTCGLAVTLSGHDVSILALISVILTMLAAGLQFTFKVANAAATEVYRCQTHGCLVEIRAPRGTAPQRLAAFQDLATDHTQHGPAAA
ncbi:hypothetical protein ABT390_34005 [Streptomyces aurantiacus]|uniref:Uncharacterized protein n=1 Tax=Streptomyces aurantiacus JA 4570 TaxID=1286094 RepID=S4AZU1_9ACTN|nr:hypothetical protein [Streptomyces aurantiacus]EPH46867.1 hypothetical protein STRAU_0033 [Streptomyces aurantiacus JA 4570]